jgi:hypothetical protein
LVPSIPWYQQILLHLRIRNLSTQRQRGQFMIAPYVDFPRLLWRIVRGVNSFARDAEEERRGKSGKQVWGEWVREYSAGHQNPVNRACHTAGIPMIARAILVLPVVLWRPAAWYIAAGLFVLDGC